MKSTYKHIHFIPATQKLDKDGYICRNTRGEVLGYVYWFEEWDQYCYYDAVYGIYSQSCLEDIAHFLSQLKEEGG